MPVLIPPRRPPETKVSRTHASKGAGRNLSSSQIRTADKPGDLLLGSVRDTITAGLPSRRLLPRGPPELAPARNASSDGRGGWMGPRGPSSSSFEFSWTGEPSEIGEKRELESIPAGGYVGGCCEDKGGAAPEVLAGVPYRGATGRRSESEQQRRPILPSNQINLSNSCQSSFRRRVCVGTPSRYVRASLHGRAAAKGSRSLLPRVCLQARGDARPARTTGALLPRLASDSQRSRGL
ncbi:hypothetical protein KM043_010510 [Ampulex compressa]|nr:hypothetical protein KM043_010510 [Ampulex compressa]